MIARAESGQARDNMAEFDAAEIARDVGELYEPLAEEKGLALKVEAPLAAPVRGNRELVSQALANLVDNAIKYAGPEASKINGTPAEIVVGAGADGERIMLTVADRGPGIPEADRGRVVERFVRLEQSRSQPGSGLGLSLASAVARLHGGELKLEDNHPGLRSVSLCRAPDRRARDAAARARQAAAKQTPDEAALVRRLDRRAAAPLGAGPHARRGLARGHRAERRRQGARIAGRGRIRRCANLLGGIAEAAPYLWDLIRADPARLLRLLSGDPEEELAALLADDARAPPRRRAGPRPLMRILRRMKAEAALLIALADIGGVWPVARVTAALTDVAETALGAAVRHLLARSRGARQARSRPIREIPRRAPAMSCSRWARWAATS